MDEARLLDEIAAAATPARRDRWIDGWWCKASPDLPFRRANAVLPAPEAGTDPERDRATLDEVRRHHRHLGQRLLIQVADRADDRLDALLAADGLAVEAPVEVLAAGEDAVAGIAALAIDALAIDDPRGRMRADLRPEVGVVRGVDEGWSRAHGTIDGGDDRDRRRTLGYGRMLAVLGDRALAATATVDGPVAGVGYGVVDGAWLGVFGMATGPAHRRRGVARAVLGALVAAGRDVGATRAYLQVETDNVAAHALYAGLGFALHHRYHYRSEPEPPGTPPLRSGSDAGADLC